MKVKNVFLLLLTASIQEVVLVAQSVGMNYVGLLTFNCVRCLMGGVVLFPCIWFFDRKDKRKKQISVIPGARETLVIGGICCGVALYLASSFQQFGIQYIAVRKARSTTTYYIAIVPILDLLLGRKHSPVVTGAVVLSLTGLYMLYMEDGKLSISKGDLPALVCTFLFVVHIMVADLSSSVVDGTKMSCTQFFASDILSEAAMLIYETPEWNQIIAAWTPAPYAGIMPCGVTYTLQIVGQKGVNPAAASLILNLESSILVLAGWMVLG